MFMYSRYHIMPQVIRQKMTFITMFLNSTPMVSEFIDTLFDNSYAYDFGTRTKKMPDGNTYEIDQKMWGNQIISSGKRIDARVEKMVGIREEFQGCEPTEGVMIDKDNPKNITYYEKRAWDLDYPLIESSYQQYPDPVTNEKMIDVDLHGIKDKRKVKGNLFTHNPQSAKKLEEKMELVKLHNSSNRLIPTASVAKTAESMTAIFQELSDSVKSNLGLKKSDRTYFSGGGLHVVMNWDKEKMHELKKSDLVCGSNSYRGWIRLPGATNYAMHMQCSFPLFGWNKVGIPIDKAYAMSNPCFFMLRTGNRIQRVYDDFLTGQGKTTEITLQDFLYKFHRATVPSSSLVEQYTTGYLKAFHPDLYMQEIGRNDAVFGRGLDKKLRWQIIRKIQKQHTLPLDEMKRLCGVKL